jgi:hypothetical protein
MIEAKDGLINAGVYSADVFLQLIHEHAIWLLFCGFLPPQFIICEELPIKQHMILRLRKLRESVLNEVNRTWHKAYNRIMREKDFEKGRKLFVYTFRYLNWGMELAHHGSIQDVTFGNDIHDEALVLSDGVTDPKQLYDKLKNHYEQKFIQVKKEFTLIAPHREPDVRKNVTSLSHAAVVMYRNALRDLLETIREGGIDLLTKHFSVHVEHANQEQICRVDGQESPFDDYPMIALCNGIVLSNELVYPVLPYPTVIPRPSFLPNDVRGAEMLLRKYQGTALQVTVRVYKQSVENLRVTMYKSGDAWRLVAETEFHWHTSFQYTRSSTLSFESEQFWSVWNKNQYKFPSDDGLVSYVFDFDRSRETIALVHALSVYRDVIVFRNTDSIATSIGCGCSSPIKNLSYHLRDDVSQNALTFITLVSQLELDVRESILDRNHTGFELLVDITSQGITATRRFVLPSSISGLSRLLWFIEDAIDCTYWSIEQLPKDILDTILDVARATFERSVTISTLLEEFAESSGEVRITPRGNVLEMYNLAYNKCIVSVKSVIDKVTEVYEHVRKDAAEKVTENIFEYLKSKNQNVKKKDSFVKVITAAVMTIHTSQGQLNAQALIKLIDLSKLQSMIDSYNNVKK